METKMTKPVINPEKQAALVKAVWEVLEASGMCDGFGGAEYRRCEPIVFDFVATIYAECNGVPEVPQS